MLVFLDRQFWILQPMNTDLRSRMNLAWTKPETAMTGGKVNGISEKKDQVQEQKNQSNCQESMGIDDNQIQYNHWRITKYCYLISLSGLALGFEVGSADKYINDAGFVVRYGINDLMVGFIMASFNLGGIIGSLIVLASNQQDQFVMIKLAYIGYCIGIIANGINFFINHVILVISYRIVIGIGTGILLLITPMYLLKYNLDAKTRGLNLSLFQLNICSGIVIGNLFNLIPDKSVAQYGLNLIMVVITMITIKYLPRTYYQETNLLIKQKWFKIKGSELPHLLEPSYNVQFKFKKLIYCNLLSIFQALIGINFYFYYASHILTTGQIILLTVVNLVGSIGATKLIDTSPRLLLLKLGTLGLIGVTLTYYWFNHWVLTSIIILIFSLTWGPVTNILINEYANLNYIILCETQLLNFMINFGLLLILSLLLPIIGLNIIFIFVSSMVVLVPLLFLIPETKYLSLLDLEHILD